MALIQAVQDLKSGDWHGLNAAHVWSLWTWYACTALYAHAHAWDEIGFPGPAYPRGYNNAGVGKREPFETPDAHHQRRRRTTRPPVLRRISISGHQRRRSHKTAGVSACCPSWGPPSARVSPPWPSLISRPAAEASTSHGATVA